MFYLRALENDRKTTTPGLRKYYSGNKFSRLFESNLMENLNYILNFWCVVNNHEELEDELWSSNINILKLLDMLTSYPNEFWKYPVVNYYLQHKDKSEFEENFLKFLKSFFVNLCSGYIITPTVNAVKKDILNLNTEIIDNEKPKIAFKKVEKDIIKSELKTPHRNVVRMLLKLIAYDNKNQKGLLPNKWEIEHILPKKWQDSYFAKVSDEVVEDIIEHLGNKIPFEKRLNIVASNGYYTKKKQYYKKSNISIVKELSGDHLSDWKLEQIMERDIRLSDRIMEIFDDWSSN